MKMTSNPYEIIKTALQSIENNRADDCPDCFRRMIAEMEKMSLPDIERFNLVIERIAETQEDTVTYDSAVDYIANRRNVDKAEICTEMIESLIPRTMQNKLRDDIAKRQRENNKRRFYGEKPQDISLTFNNSVGQVFARAENVSSY